MPWSARRACAGTVVSITDGVWGAAMTGRSQSVVGRFIVAMLLAASAGLAAERSLDGHLAGWDVARFAPQSGRLVLDHQGEFVVVRSGDAVPGLQGVRLKAIGPRGALLEIEEGRETHGLEQQSMRWLLIRPATDGTLEVIEISRDPGEELQPEVVMDSVLFQVVEPPQRTLPGADADAHEGEPR